VGGEGVPVGLDDRAQAGGVQAVDGGHGLDDK
jgi:hypothetical protein